MVAYAAVSYSAKGAAKPALGTVKIEADTSVAVSERLVNFTSVKLTETQLPRPAERSASGSRRHHHQDVRRRAR